MKTFDLEEVIQTYLPYAFIFWEKKHIYCRVWIQQLRITNEEDII